MTTQLLAIDLGPALRHFLAAVRAPSMPTIDVDAALSQLFDELRHLQGVEDRLSSVIYFMSFSDGLFSFESFDDPDLPGSEQMREKIAHATAQLGEVVKNHLLRLDAYSGGVCPYSFRSLVNDTTILLAR